MKKIAILLFTIVATLSSCKEKAKDSKTEETTEASAEKFVVKPEATSVKFTAYKTTAKKGVGGEFKTLNFESKTGNSVKEALNDLEFSIPVSSLFTNNAGRDSKIKEFFFGKMLNTELLKGMIKHDGSGYYANLTMNGVTKKLPLEVSVTDERRVTMKGDINLKEWDALAALASLNKVCYELHKGDDGISKTWEDVSLEVSTFLRKS